VSISDFNILGFIVGHLLCTGVQHKVSQTTGCHFMSRLNKAVLREHVLDCQLL